LDKLTRLENRELLYALYPYLWDVREEVAVLARYLQWLQAGPGSGEMFSAPEEVANTYRGGLAASIQRLLPMDEGGRIQHVPEE
jgi:hypothetical protein